MPPLVTATGHCLHSVSLQNVKGSSPRASKMIVATMHSMMITNFMANMIRNDSKETALRDGWLRLVGRIGAVCPIISHI